MVYGFRYHLFHSKSDVVSIGVTFELNKVNEVAPESEKFTVFWFWQYSTIGDCPKNRISSLGGFPL